MNRNKKTKKIKNAVLRAIVDSRDEREPLDYLHAIVYRMPDPL
jgi:hypothetical protein